MKIEQIEITGEGFSMLIDVEAEYIDVPAGRDSGETGGQDLHERQLTGVEYPNFMIKRLITDNEDYKKQVMDQVWAHLEKYGD